MLRFPSATPANSPAACHPSVANANAHRYQSIATPAHVAVSVGQNANPLNQNANPLNQNANPFDQNVNPFD